MVLTDAMPEVLAVATAVLDGDRPAASDVVAVVVAELALEALTVATAVPDGDRPAASDVVGVVVAELALEPLTVATAVLDGDRPAASEFVAVSVAVAVTVSGDNDVLGVMLPLADGEIEGVGDTLPDTVGEALTVAVTLAVGDTLALVLLEAATVADTVIDSERDAWTLALMLTLVLRESELLAEVEALNDALTVNETLVEPVAVNDLEAVVVSEADGVRDLLAVTEMEMLRLAVPVLLREAEPFTVTEVLAEVLRDTLALDDSDGDPLVEVVAL